MSGARNKCYQVFGQINIFLHKACYKSRFIQMKLIFLCWRGTNRLLKFGKINKSFPKNQKQKCYHICCASSMCFLDLNLYKERPQSLYGLSSGGLKFNITYHAEGKKISRTSNGNANINAMNCNFDTEIQARTRARVMVFVMPLSFHNITVNRGSQFYGWRKPEYPENTTDLPQVTNKPSLTNEDFVGFQP